MIESSRKLRIGVMGPGTCTPETAHAAEAVGRLIAEQEAILICGGRAGVMEAASMGASEAGGVVVGILDSDDERTANRFVTIPILTAMGQGRNVINVLTSHSVIALGGGAGTLSEIALAARTGTPVVGLDTWSAGLGESELPVFRATDPASAVAEAIRLARQRVQSMDADRL